MSQPLSEFTGAALYLDTMIPYALLRGIDPAAQSLFERIQSGELSAYTSVLTCDELAYRMLLALIGDHYGGSPLDKLRDQEASMIAEFYPRIAPQLAQLRTFPHLRWIDLTTSDLDAMDESILRYNIRPRDALHLAAMRVCGCLDLASRDADFDRVPHIRRWTL